MTNAHSLVDISVVAANYNNSAFLEDFFVSWLSSAVMPRELVFVDDGSTDCSLDIARGYQSRLPALEIIELGRNLGFAQALNAGVGRASGKYILRVDPDDVVLPDKLARQLSVLESGQADVVGTNAVVFQSDSGKEIRTTNFPLQHSAIAKTIRRGEHGVLHATVMAHSRLFKENPYVQDNVPAEDYDIFARMLRSGARFANLSEPLLRYRIHQRSASNVLPFNTIAKTYRIRDEIFGGRTSKALVVLYYLHIKLYRKYLFAPARLQGLLYLAAASLLRPDKALRRVGQLVRSLRTRTRHPLS